MFVQLEIQVYFGDILGEMGFYYCFVFVIFFGGFFNEVGGYNLVEVMLLGLVLLIGLKVVNVWVVYKDLWVEVVVVCVMNFVDFVEVVRGLLEDGDRWVEQVEYVYVFVMKGWGVLQKIIDLFQFDLLGNV